MIILATARSRALRVFPSLFAVVLTACSGDDAPDAAPPDATLMDAPVDGAPDAPTDPDAPDAPGVSDGPDGDDLGDRLLCEAMCARQDRSRCALFDRDRCERECVATVAMQSTRCRREVEQSLRCRASGASYLCDDRGLPTTSECGVEGASLSRCLGVVDPDAGDATPDVATDATVDATVDTTPDAAPDALDDDAPSVDVMDVTTDIVIDVTTDIMADVAPPDAATDIVTDVAPPDTATDAVIDAPPPNPCASPVDTITMPGVAVARDGLTSGRSGITAALCAPDTTGPEQVWRLAVTARTGVVIDTEATRTGFDTVVSVRRTCDDIRTELLCDNDSGRDNTALIRAIVDPGMYSLVVDGLAAMAGPYSLRVRSFAPAANAACATALALAPGATLAGQNAVNGGLRGDHCRAAATGGPLFYSVAVPAMSRVTVRAVPTSATPWIPLLGATNACSSRTCVAQSAGEAAGVASTIPLVNNGTTALTFFVSVASATSAEGTFDLSASAPTSIAPGGTCATAPVLVSGTARTGQDLSVAFQSGAGLCLPGFTGAQLYFVMRVGARQRGVATVTPRGTMAPVVRVLRSCLATACESSTQAPAGSPATRAFDNPDGVSVDVLVAVSNAAGAGGVFDIVASVVSIPAGVTCTGPTALTPGTVAIANTFGGTMSGAAACEPMATGPQLFYTLRIPAGQRGTVRATPTGATPWRPTLRAFDNCTTPICTQFASATAVGVPALLSIDNTTTAARDVVFTVSGSGPSPGGPVDVLATITAADPVPYVITTIPVACDAVSATSAVAPVDGWDDDTSTDPIALPFAFRFFEATPTHFAVCSNGFVQLLTSATVEPSFANVNVAMPNNRDPNGLVAPFWDDLIPLDETTDVRAASLGSSPRRRLVVQWTDWQVIGDTASRLVFQSKLFEGTNVIEYHYCSATPARTLPLGASATIGLESLDGSRAVGVAHNRFNAVDPANAYRLTPR